MHKKHADLSGEYWIQNHSLNQTSYRARQENINRDRRWAYLVDFGDCHSTAVGMGYTVTTNASSVSVTPNAPLMPFAGGCE